MYVNVPPVLLLQSVLPTPWIGARSCPRVRTLLGQILSPRAYISFHQVTAVFKMKRKIGNTCGNVCFPLID